MSFTPHPFQHDAIDQTRAHLRSGARSVLLQLPTGGGKTVIASVMFEGAMRKQKISWFIVHRRELVQQAALTFMQHGVPVGVVSAGYPMRPDAPVQICAIQSLAKRMSRLPRPHFIGWDECHHLAARSWMQIHEQQSQAIHVGFTATPHRLDGSGLRPYFEAMVQGPSTAWLIANGFLCPFRYYAPSRVVLDQVATQMGDYHRGQASAAMDKPSITGDAVSHYLEAAPGRRAVVFACKVEHSRHIVESFVAAGVRAVHVDGETPTPERDQAIADFREGRIQVLSNVELFGEGFDLPALEVAILLRPTKSLALFLQQVGRALRTCPGKQDAVILDHASNVQIHGLPDDEREWSLDAQKRGRKSPATPGVRVCPECYGACPPGKPVCPYCGMKFVADAAIPDAVEGSLVELSPAQRVAMKRQRYAEQAACSTLEELVALANSRGYKSGEAWARYVFEARKARGGVVAVEG